METRRGRIVTHKENWLKVGIEKKAFTGFLVWWVGHCMAEEASGTLSGKRPKRGEEKLVQLGMVALDHTAQGDIARRLTKPRKHQKRIEARITPNQRGQGWVVKHQWFEETCVLGGIWFALGITLTFLLHRDQTRKKNISQSTSIILERSKNNIVAEHTVAHNPYRITVPQRETIKMHYIHGVPRIGHTSWRP